jgi:hypothetical protein
VSPFKKYSSYTIGRAAKVHTERLELSGYYLPRILLASGELSDEILITLVFNRKKSLEAHFFN